MGQLEKHRANENCASCHRVMDAIGFGLENYDPIGKWRTHHGKSALDVSGELPSGKRFESPAELKRILRDSEADAITGTITKKLMTYALGRDVEHSDNPVVDAIQPIWLPADTAFPY